MFSAVSDVNISADDGMLNVKINLDSSKKKKFIPKKLSRVKLVSKVTNIFKHVKSLSFILLPKKLHLIEKRYNAVLLLNRLGTDPDKMSVSELNVVYNNFKGNM